MAAQGVDARTAMFLYRKHRKEWEKEVRISTRGGRLKAHAKRQRLATSQNERKVAEQDDDDRERNGDNDDHDDDFDDDESLV